MRWAYLIMNPSCISTMIKLPPFPDNRGLLSNPKAAMERFDARHVPTGSDQSSGFLDKGG